MSDAERALLGSVFLDNSALDSVQSTVRAEDFESHAHRLIWSSFLRLATNGTPIDYVSVTQDTGLPGHEMAELADAVPSSANVRHYGEMVHDAGTKRNTITALRETLESVERMDTAEDIIESVTITVLR